MKILLILLLSQTGLSRWEPWRGRDDFAFFEFAPSGGAGMGTACACTTPTGAKGETMTFTRASSGTCLKGNTTSGIANGDLVTCSTNQPRVMPGGDGTGGNGLLVEGPRTNDALRSEEFDNAAWVKVASGVAAPTVTADAATAPDNTTTADRIQIPATTAGQYSVVDQSAGTYRYSGSLFIKGNSQSGTLDLDCHNGSDHCSTCAYVADSWTRCSCDSVTSGASLFIFGNYGAGCGSARDAQDFFAWGAQVESGAFVTSYIKTAGASVTRAAETATFSLVLAGSVGGSMAATIVAPATNFGADGVDHGIVSLSTAGPSYKQLLDYSTLIGFLFYISTGGSVSSGEGVVANTPARTAVYWDTSNRSIVAPSGATTTNSHSGATDTTLVEVGAYNAAAQVQAVVKRVCVDPNLARCR
jgi:hypothetical protein